MNDMLDEVLGLSNILDRFISLTQFLFAPKSRRARRFSRLDLQQFSIPRSDRMAAEGKRTVSLNETIAYLERFGVKAVRNGFDSQNMYFQVRRSQNAKGWVDRLLNVDTDGIPQLDHGRKSWDDAKREQTPTRFWRDSRGRVRRATKGYGT